MKLVLFFLFSLCSLISLKALVTHGQEMTFEENAWEQQKQFVQRCEKLGQYCREAFNLLHPYTTADCIAQDQSDTVHTTVNIADSLRDMQNILVQLCVLRRHQDLGSVYPERLIEDEFSQLKACYFQLQDHCQENSVPFLEEKLRKINKHFCRLLPEHLRDHECIPR